MTIVVVLAIAAVVSLLFGSFRHDFAPILITVLALMTFLGLNLTIIGLDEFSSAMFRVVAGFIGLILAMSLVFAVTYLGHEWKRLRTATDGWQR